MFKTGSISVRHIAAFVVAGVASTGLLVVTQAAPAGADSVTFSSASIGTTGNTPVFGQPGPWLMSWSYNCSNFGQPGTFGVEIDQPPGDFAFDIGPNEEGSSGSGTDYYFDSGAFQLSVISECHWTISVTPSWYGPNSTPVTYSSSQTGDSGGTQRFSVSSTWTMSWSYNCANFGFPGNFSVNVTQPSGDLTFDLGPNELGLSGSGTDTYTDTGVFSLEVNSECNWSITINSAASPSPAPAPGPAPAAPTAVGIASTPNGGGYWIAHSNGAVSPHGNAINYGGVSNLVLNVPINHIVSTPDGGGYWLVAADGGTFTEGDAHFYGSTGSMRLNALWLTWLPHLMAAVTGSWGLTVGSSLMVTPYSMARRGACA